MLPPHEMTRCDPDHKVAGIDLPSCRTHKKRTSAPYGRRCRREASDGTNLAMDEGDRPAKNSDRVLREKAPCDPGPNWLFACYRLSGAAKKG